MLAPLRNPIYRRLFAAQVVALGGTGLATVALALLAYDLAGGEGGEVLGVALAIKMVAYVGVAPVANAVAERVPCRALLVAMDVVRAVIALLLPFVDQVWQVYLLVFLLQSASATFTPAFQATIPDVLPEEKDYTKALSLSRLAYDLENLLSPTLAAALLAVTSFHWLFAGTCLGFAASAFLVLSTAIPQPEREGHPGFYERTTRGVRIYLATPRLRGLLALNLAVASAGAMVIVNTVVVVRGVLGGSEADVAVALAFFGAGSMMAALVLPRLLEHLSDRTAMFGGAVLMALGLLFAGTHLSLAPTGWEMLFAVWFVLGLGYSSVLTPTGRLLRRSAREEDRGSIFAAQFALSHACWLLTYPLAGVVGAEVGVGVAGLALGTMAAGAVLTGMLLWSRRDPEVVDHVHEDLPPEHPHVRDAAPARGGLRHAHVFVIDSHHRHWPA